MDYTSLLISIALLPDLSHLNQLQVMTFYFQGRGPLQKDPAVETRMVAHRRKLRRAIRSKTLMSVAVRSCQTKMPSQVIGRRRLQLVMVKTLRRTISNRCRRRAGCGAVSAASSRRCRGSASGCRRSFSKWSRLFSPGIDELKGDSPAKTRRKSCDDIYFLNVL